MAKSQHISTLPVYDRGFAANAHTLESALTWKSFDFFSLKHHLTIGISRSPFRTASKVDSFGQEYPSLPPEEEMLLYVVGFQYVAQDVPGRRDYDPEPFGFIMTTEGATIQGGEDHIPYYSKVFQNRRILAMGEPYLVPADEFTLLPSFFVNRAATEHEWEEKHSVDSTRETSRVYGRSLLLVPHFIDEPYDQGIHSIDFKGQMIGYWLEIHNNVRNLPPE